MKTVIKNIALTIAFGAAINAGAIVKAFAQDFDACRTSSGYDARCNEVARIRQLGKDMQMMQEVRRPRDTNNFVSSVGDDSFYAGSDCRKTGPNETTCTNRIVPNAGVEFFYGHKPGSFISINRNEPQERRIEWCSETSTVDGGESRCYSAQDKEHPLPDTAPFTLSVMGFRKSVQCYVHTSRVVDPTPDAPPSLGIAITNDGKGNYPLRRDHYRTPDVGCTEFKATVLNSEVELQHDRRAALMQISVMPPAQQVALLELIGRDQPAMRGAMCQQIDDLVIMSSPRLRMFCGK